MTGDKLATSAILLGYAEITSSFTTASTSAVLATGLSTTVTIPSGGRRVKITAYAQRLSNTLTDNVQLSIWDGTVGSGTRIGGSLTYVPVAHGSVPCHVIALPPAPPAGSKTYNVGVQTSSGSVSINATAADKAFILVELV